MPWHVCILIDITNLCRFEIFIYTKQKLNKKTPYEKSEKERNSCLASFRQNATFYRTFFFFNITKDSTA